jgi:hypothetical protein
MSQQSIFTIIKNRPPFLLAITMLMSVNSFGETNKPVADYLSVPGPIVFETKSFYLNWSSHPAASFYKQEYIPEGELANEYKTMLLLDVMTSAATIKTAVAQKLAELKQLKAANPLVNYATVDPKNGEYIIDFILTANAPNGSINIVERNVYRYKILVDKAGQKGVVLFGISTRAYGAGVDPFFASLKSTQNDLVKKVNLFKMPEITIR